MLENVLKKVETVVRRDKKKQDKLEGTLKKQRMIEIHRLRNLLDDRKDVGNIRSDLSLRHCHINRVIYF